MKLYRVRAVAWKELLHVLRDPRSLGMAVAIPMLMLLLFGYALTLDVDQVALRVWDQSETPASRELLARFQASRYFSVGRAARSYPELERAVDRREALLGLVIPADFGRRLGSRRSAPVQLLADGSDSNTATIALGYAEAVVQGYSTELAVRAVRRSAPSGGGRGLASPVEYRPRVWFNADLESRNYIIPGLIAVIMMVIAALLTSLTVAKEWETGTMEQLISTPVKGPELVIGKLLPYFGVGLVDVTIAVLVGELLFGVPLRGSVALLFASAAAFLTGALALGLLISVVTKSQLLASQLAMILTFLPAFLLSGFMYAISNMPAPIRLATHLIPARYFVALLKGIYLKGVGLDVLAGEAALLGVFGIATVFLAVRKFRKKIA